MAQLQPPFDQREGFVWFDGKLVDWKEANLHVLSHSLHYGSAVFEGERAYNGKIFKSAEHTRRLFKSAELCGYSIPYSFDEIEAAKKQVMEKNNLTDCYVRPIAWRGSEEMGLGARNCAIHLAIAVWPWGAYFGEEKLKTGLRFKISDWRRPPANCTPCQAKAAGLYVICTLSKHEAIDSGYDDVLMLDWRGRVAECSAANIFFVMDGELHTPEPDCFLNGITRQTVIALAKRRGIKVVERAILPEELGKATEVFVTGTAAEIVPVGEIAGHKYTPGNITTMLRNDYIKETGRSS